MIPPLRIQFPVKFASSVTSKDTIPPDYPYKIDASQKLHIISELGEYISQTINGEEFWMELLTIKLFKDTPIHLLVNRPFISVGAMLSGEIPVQSIGASMLSLASQSYNIFYLPKEQFQLQFPAGECTILYIIPGSYYLKGMAQEHPGLDNIIRLFNSQNENGAMLENYLYPYRVQQILKEITESKETGIALNIAIHRYILEILGLYYTQLRKIGLNLHHQSSADNVQSIRDFILSNLEDPELGSLSQLSTAFYITPKTLAREFKKQFGLTVREFIKESRLFFAFKLLQNEEKLVKEVAISAGFSSPANFSREFKRKFKVSPESVRRK